VATAAEEHHHYYYGGGGGHHHHTLQGAPAPSLQRHAPPPVHYAGGCGYSGDFSHIGLPGPTKFGYTLDDACCGSGGFGGHAALPRPSTAPAKISTFFQEEKKENPGTTEAKRRLGLSGGGGGSSVYSAYSAYSTFGACACSGGGGAAAAGCRSCAAKLFDHLAKKKEASTPAPRWRDYGVPKLPEEKKKDDDAPEDPRRVLMRGIALRQLHVDRQRPQTSHGCRGEYRASYSPPKQALAFSESFQKFKSWRDVDGGAKARFGHGDCACMCRQNDDETDEEWNWLDDPPRQGHSRRRHKHKQLTAFKKPNTCTCNVERIDTRYGEKPIWKATSRGSGC